MHLLAVNLNQSADDHSFGGMTSILRVAVTVNGFQIELRCAACTMLNRTSISFLQ